jgi:hypothetical protein
VSLKPSKTKKKPRRRILSPSSLREGLTRELTLLRPVYASLHTEHPALEAYPTLEGLLDRLTHGPHDDAQKHLLVALITLRQSSTQRAQRLCVAILTRAFWPMLGKHWKKLVGSDPQERLALLMMSFLDALTRVDPTLDPLRVAMYVQQMTRRGAFKALSWERDWTDVGFGEDADEQPDGRTPDPLGGHSLVVTADRLRRRGALMAHVRDVHRSAPRNEQLLIYRKLRYGLERLPPSAAALANEVTL